MRCDKHLDKVPVARRQKEDAALTSLRERCFDQMLVRILIRMLLFSPQSQSRSFTIVFLVVVVVAVLIFRLWLFIL